MAEFINYDSQELYDRIITELEESIGEPLFPGDERRIYAESLVPVFMSIYATVNETAKKRMVQYADGEYLDALGESEGVYRMQPQPADTEIVFNIKEIQTSEIEIPSGIRISPDGIVFFKIKETAIIESGEVSSNAVVAECEEKGEKYNGYKSGSINQIVDIIKSSSQITATNISESASGSDGEPYTEDGDNAYRKRIMIARDKASTAGTEESYKYWALSADDSIADAYITSTSACVVSIYILGKDGKIPDDETVQKAQSTCSSDSVRPITDQVQVYACTEQEYNIEMTYYAMDENIAYLREKENELIENYKIWQCEKLGRSVNPDKLRKLFLDAGAERVEITSPILTEVEKTKVAICKNVSIKGVVVDEA